MSDKKPIVYMADEKGEPFAFRCGIDLYIYVGLNSISQQLQTTLVISGNLKDLIMRWENASVSEVVAMVEKAEREALKRMESNG